MKIFQDIEQATQRYAEKRDVLRAVAEQCKAEVDDVRRRYRSDIRALASKVAALKDALTMLIQEHREAFIKPRTRVFSGIKVGLKKLPGRVEFHDPIQRTIELIRKRLPEHAEHLIRVREELNREAIRELDAKALAAIGASIVDTADMVVIDHACDEIDALIDALTQDSEVS